jgi:hypothetical protein
LPLVRATGAGAASRHSIGTGVFGGMLAATFLAIFFVPLFFVLIRHSKTMPILAEKTLTLSASPVPAAQTGLSPAEVLLTSGSPKDAM